MLCRFFDKSNVEIYACIGISKTFDISYRTRLCPSPPPGIPVLFCRQFAIAVSGFVSCSKKSHAVRRKIAVSGFLCWLLVENAPPLILETLFFFFVMGVHWSSAFTSAIFFACFSCEGFPHVLHLVTFAVTRPLFHSRYLLHFFFVLLVLNETLHTSNN